MVSFPNRQGDSVDQDQLQDKKSSADSVLFENLKWLTSREAVVYLRLSSEGCLRNLVLERKIPFAKLGRRLRFDREALDRFLESSHRLQRSRKDRLK